MRICNACGVEKPLDAFELAARYRDGRMPRCRTCRKQYREELKKRPRAAVASKVCTRCQKDLPLDQFTTDARHLTGRGARCRSCRSETRSTDSPEVARNRMMLWRYGISTEEYEQRLAAQGGVCLLCGGTPNGSRKYLDVDHHHETGAVRGLLCSNCNTALGLLKEDPERMIRMADYIKRSEP